MKIKLKSPRILLKESKNIRTLVRKQTGEKANLDEISNIISTCLGYKNFSQYKTESKREDSINIESLNFLKRRSLLLLIQNKIQDKYPNIFYEEVSALRYLIEKDREIMANMLPLSPNDFIRINPAIGLINGAILNNGILSKDVFFRSMKTQIGNEFQIDSLSNDELKLFEYFSEIINDSGKIDSIIKAHKHTRIILLSLYVAAKDTFYRTYRKNHIHTDIQFIKNKDRVLWLSFQSIGSKEVFIECMYVILKYKEERGEICSADKVIEDKFLYIENNFSNNSNEVLIASTKIEDEFQNIRNKRKIKESNIYIGEKLKSSKFPVLSDESTISRGVFMLGGVNSGLFKARDSLLYNFIRDGRGGIIMDNALGNMGYFNILSFASSLNREMDIVLVNFINDSENFLNSDLLSILSVKELYELSYQIISTQSDDISRITLDLYKLIYQSILKNENIESVNDYFSYLNLESILDKLEADDDAYVNVKYFIENNFTNKNEIKDKYRLIQLRIKSSIEEIEDKFKRSIYNSNDFDFLEAIKNNKIIYVLMDTLGLDKESNALIENFVVKKYFSALGELCMESKGIEVSVDEVFNSQNALAPFMFLCDCVNLNPDYLRTMFDNYRWKIGLKPIYALRYSDVAERLYGDSFLRLVSLLQTKLIMKTEDCSAKILELLSNDYGTNITANDLRAQSAGEAYYFYEPFRNSYDGYKLDSAKMNRIKMSYVDYRYIKTSKVIKRIPLL